MTFEELQVAWNKIEVQPKSQKELLEMTRSSRHPRLRRMKRKLIVECLFFAVVVTTVIIIADLFSGPLWLTVAFIAPNALYLFNDFLCYNYLKILPQRGSLKLSLIKFSQRMRLLVFLSRIAGVSMGLVTVLILALRFQVNFENIVLWSLLIPVLICVTWLVSRNWVRRVVEVRKLLRELNEGS